jgi:HlyD family secretion protein
VVEIANNANIKNAGTEAEVTTFLVRMALTTPMPGGLPGMSAEVTIGTETHDNAVVVPIQAIAARTERELHPEGAGAGPVVENQLALVNPGHKKPAREPMQKVVFVVEDGVAKARRVEIGLASDTEVEILSGVKEGETIIEGPYKAVSKELKDSKPVEQEKKEEEKGKKS